ncbi:glycoside hydrolase family 99-like domain-containing protein [Paenactinomyces guangxiensis]|uniref:Glycoside hydrolase family 99-like domain-containing protein n=1 Tax=Paenactinomyces guangxiensis TaxID=1490290 RepID=A0A7W1WQQ4_9BACL|nr:glycoside hydrolase family 99-like domain-containing protein [Paenactinomyces guangxiensis]MBA4494334.1 glycoside hydrolase family 99-like domain-containing protein [Paenactinomyces guangxiensis]MBH8590829.1 glycoside hydrolase family 99-like domain-containing protein [Paenactinomyces guangxiensis]
MNLHQSDFGTKIIAIYLPQFHRIPENDRWWGEGFTEWTNTRKAKPLFSGHYQPREPYRDYYYDLTDPKARKWQADIAMKYEIYGFCYYHYWFKGKLLLETPFKEVLRTGEPDFPFCLSWANGHWTRTWDGLEHHILMRQDYGDEEDWKMHFDYLLPAFMDKRYIRVDNKPLFLIYQPWHVRRCEDMLEYWNKLAKINGLEGIYFVETIGIGCHRNMPGFNARMLFEPFFTTSYDLPKHTFSRFVKTVPALDQKRYIKLFNYDVVWEQILQRIVPSDKPTFLGAFLDWDNSARRGYDALIFYGAHPEKFVIYFDQLVKKANRVKSEFVFINAWNEWAEGTYLEPDKKYGFGYLEAVKKASEI